MGKGPYSSLARLVFSDFNLNGIVDLEEDDPATPLNELEITQAGAPLLLSGAEVPAFIAGKSHYYPPSSYLSRVNFGMNHLGPWYETVAPAEAQRKSRTQLREE